MKKKLQFILVGCITLLFSFCQQKEEFSLMGKTQDFTNGEKLYLRLGEKIIDSTEVINNTFQFNTKFEEYPVQVILSTKKYEHYRFLWLEDSEMTFDASQSDFRHAPVTGSENEVLSMELSKIKAPYEDDRTKTIEIEQNFIKEHAEKAVSANILSIYSSTWGKEKTEELYAYLSDDIKASSYGQDIKRYIDLAVEPKIGDAYANFIMNDVNGNPVSLSEYEGKVVLLEFWSSNCGPCRIENPNLVKTYERYKPKGFEILGVSLDETKENWLKAVEKDQLPWRQVSDLKGQKNKAAVIYGVSFIPDNFLIGANGTIIHKNLRGKRLDQRLEEIFGQP